MNTNPLSLSPEAVEILLQDPEKFLSQPLEVKEQALACLKAYPQIIEGVSDPALIVQRLLEQNIEYEFQQLQLKKGDKWSKVWRKLRKIDPINLLFSLFCITFVGAWVAPYIMYYLSIIFEALMFWK